jgi:hypothetical protein
MTSPLRALISELELRLPELDRGRSSSAFANDVFEATDDLIHLGHYALDGNTKVDYPGRLRQERQLWKQLNDSLRNRPVEDHDQYASVFHAAERVLRIVELVPPAEGGYLGSVRIILDQFNFLQTEYHFVIEEEGSLKVRFSSGTVYVELSWAKTFSASCVFGPESNPGAPFWIDDLLFMYHDQQFHNLPNELNLKTDIDVKRWFAFLASVFKHYGRDVLTNRPGIFDELTTAQRQRDFEYSREMNRRFGQG